VFMGFLKRNLGFLFDDSNGWLLSLSRFQMVGDEIKVIKRKGSDL